MTRRTTTFALAGAALLLGVVALGALHDTGLDAGWRLPDRWNPFAPLRIDAEPSLFTRYKLARLRGDPTRCLAALATSRYRFEPLPDRSTAPGCGFDNAVRIERSAFALGAPFTLSCPAAVSLALWEQHTVQVAAQRYFGEAVVRLEHLGSYVCRNVNGREAAPRSQHATAEAIDVSGFVLRSGRRVRVAADWSAHGAGATAAADFWHASRDGACGFFDAVLSPDYNAAHADHLHLDLGPYRMCR